MTYGFYKRENSMSITNNKNINIVNVTKKNSATFTHPLNMSKIPLLSLSKTNSNVSPYSNTDHNKKLSTVTFANSNTYEKNTGPNSTSSIHHIIKPDFPFNTHIAEQGLRLFYLKNKDKLLDRVSKGPPESYRWLAWTVCGKLPLERSPEIYYENLKEHLTQEDDQQILKDLTRTLPDLLPAQL